MQSFNDGTILSTAKHFIWYKPMTWLPAIIRYFTKGIVSHSAVVINIDGICMVAESKVPKVQLQTLESWIIPHMDVYVTIPDVLPGDFRNRVLSKVGYCKYDYRGLFLTQPFQILTGIWIPTVKGDTGEPFTCSEFVSYAVGIAEPWKMKPMDLLNKFNNWKLI